jgi:hypothetical protein
MLRDRVRIGAGAAFSGDRIDPARVLAERGDLDYLVFECLAERTIALAQLRKRSDASKGYDPLLDRRMEALLPLMRQHRFRIVSNMGAANPEAAGAVVLELAARERVPMSVAVVMGDDVLADLDPASPTLETGEPVSDYAPLVSANAYLGAEAMLTALASNARVILTGRVADPSLFVAPLAHELGWSPDDVGAMAAGTLVGHLLECAGQLCGGYFADPGCKDVDGMADLGFPFAEVERSGAAVVGKVDGTGGVINLATVREQLLYEVHDPQAYLTPDVSADFTRVELKPLARDRVAVGGARGNARPRQLKVSVGYVAGYLGEGEIGYAGRNAPARARLAGEIVRTRLAREFDEVRVDLIGSTSLHARAFDPAENPYEVRLRVAGRARTAALAARVGEEVEALYTNGPAGGGGARKYVHEQIGIVSILIDRERVTPRLKLMEG